MMSCEKDRVEIPSSELFSPDHDLKASDLSRQGFTEGDPGWLVKEAGGITFHYFLDESRNILFQIISFEKTESIAEADSLIKLHGGEPIVWIDAIKNDTTDVKKIGFIRSNKNGMVFYSEYVEKTKGLMIFHDYPNHFNPASKVKMAWNEYVLKCPGGG